MTTTLPSDFKEFLRLLDEMGVKYLTVRGYAVGYHGYPRSTGDMDVWVESTGENAERVVRALKEFSFDVPELSPDLFLDPDRVIRMGHPPLRIEILTSVTGVSFEKCYSHCVVAISGWTDRRANAVVHAALPKGDHRVLTPLIGLGRLF
jgi:hypothetical protein